MRALKLFKFSMVLCLCFAAPASYAGFSTYAKNWPDDAQTVDEKITKPEERDVTETTVIYTDDTNKDTYISNERVSEERRLYAKLGLTLFSAQIRNISNVSEPILSAAPVANTNANKDYASWEFGLGTKFQYVRAEIDYLYEKHVPYNVNPVFLGQPEGITSELISQSLWVALMYDMNKLNLPYFTPYIGGLAGFVWNKTRTAMYNGFGTNAAQNHSRYSIGWGVTIGLRIPFWSRWFGYFAYEYLDHGMARFQDSTGLMGLKGHYVVQGCSLGVQYLLG